MRGMAVILVVLGLLGPGVGYAAPPSDTSVQVLENREVLLKNRQIAVAKLDALAAQGTTDREFMVLLFVAFGLGMGALWFAFSRGHKEVLAAINANHKNRV